MTTNTKHTLGLVSLLARSAGTLRELVALREMRDATEVSEAVCKTARECAAELDASVDTIAAAPETAAERDRLKANNERLRAALAALCADHDTQMRGGRVVGYLQHWAEARAVLARARGE